MPTPDAPPQAPAIDYQQLLNEVGAFVYTTDERGHYTYANQLVLELLGNPPLQAIIGKSFTDFVDIGEAGAALRETDLRVLQGGETIAREETNHIHATGETFSYWTIKKPLRGPDGAIIGMLGISHDITAKKRLEDKVREQKQLLDAVLDHIPGLVYVKGANRRFLYANQQLSKTFGRPVEDIVGRLDSELMPPDVADAFWQKDLHMLATGEHYAGRESLVDASGQLRQYWSVVVPWTGFDGMPALIGLITDITELQALKDELQRQAFTDALTGMANRRSFFERAEREFAHSRLHGAPLSLITVDVDHFKQINDAYGHPAGDQVLQGFADRCQDLLRPQALCARTGGEEFCILLPGVPVDAAHAIAERIRTESAAATLSEEHPALRVTASFGVTGLSPADPHFRAVYSRADRALYTAKQQGRNRTCMLDVEKIAASP